jgi:TRAP-type C4-dicarboxylate transport system permease small subunit
MKRAASIGGALSRGFDKFLKITAYISGSIILFMMLALSYHVLMRYFFKAPTNWAPDASGYMQFALVLIGTAWVLKIDSHTKIDTLLIRLPHKVKTIVSCITSLLALVACALFVWKGVEAAWMAYVRSDFLYREVELPVAPFYALIAFSFTLLFIQFCRRFFNYIRSFRAGASDEPGKELS